MKKTYIIPETSVVVLSFADGILNSVSVNGTVSIDITTIEGGNGNDAAVKRDRGSRDAYNVWNDDWSQ